MLERLGPTPDLPEITTRQEKINRLVIDFLFRRITSEINVLGRENIPPDMAQAPYIVAVDHLGWADPLILLRTFPVWIYWMSRSENFKYWFFNPFLQKLGTFPVRREEVDIKSLKTALGLLKEGKILGMAPEGTRGHRGEGEQLKVAKHGTIFMGTIACVPIIPTAIWGTEKLSSLVDEKGIRFGNLTQLLKEKPQVNVSMGKVFDQHLKIAPGCLADRQVLQTLTTNLMIEIRNLLPGKYHGVYAGVEKQLV